MNEKIFERVKKIVSENLDVVPDKVVPQANIQTDLGGDSLDVVELVMALEEEFQIKIPDEDAQHILTIEQVVNYINSKEPVA